MLEKYIWNPGRKNETKYITVQIKQLNSKPETITC